jgi:hypothetical protein
MPDNRAKQREKTSAVLKSKAIPRPKPKASRWTTKYTQQSAKRNQTTVAQAQQNVYNQMLAGTGRVYPQTPPPAYGQPTYLPMDTYSGTAAQNMAAAQQQANAAAVALRQMPDRFMEEQARQEAAARQDSMTRRAQEMQDWYERTYLGPIAKRKLIQPRPQGYAEPVGEAYPYTEEGGGYYPYDYYGGYTGGGGGVYSGGRGGGGGVYAPLEGQGYNPARTQTPRWWHQRLSWRW